MQCLGWLGPQSILTRLNYNKHRVVVAIIEPLDQSCFSNAHTGYVAILTYHLDSSIDVDATVDELLQSAGSYYIASDWVQMVQGCQ